MYTSDICCKPTVHVPTTQVIRETLKPGATEYTLNHFLSNTHASSQYGRNSSAPKVGYESAQYGALSGVKQADFVVPDKRGIMATQPERALPDKQFISKSLYKTDYLNFTEEMSQILSHSEQEFIDSYDKIDIDKRGFITKDQLYRLIEMTIGRPPTPREFDTFIFPFRLAREKLIMRESFLKELPHISNKFKSLSQSVRGGIPDWNRSRETGRCVLGPALISSTQKDFGTFGYVPSRREYMNEYGINSTTNDINVGSVRSTTKIPGYSGFLPRAATNDTAVLHANMEPGSSEPKNNLRLFHNINMSGYTGHRPIDPSNERGPYKIDPSLTSTQDPLERAMKIWNESDMKTIVPHVSDLWHRPHVA